MFQALIVDDEPRTRTALIEAVDWRKCNVKKVYEASDIREAKLLLEGNKIEILLCDIEMPGGSGQTLVDWARDMKMLLGVIMVTCHPEFSYVRKAIRQGCYDYILKPIDYEEFQRVLHEMTGKMEYYQQNNDFLKNPDGSINWGNLDYMERPDNSREKQYREVRQAAEKRNVEQEVKEYVREHLADDLNVTAIAEYMHFNPQYLARAFKSETGRGILEYITSERIEAAKKLLVETNIPVKEIASMVGYQDYAYFTRVFKKETGISPKQYRK